MSRNLGDWHEVDKKKLVYTHHTRLNLTQRLEKINKLLEFRHDEKS